MGVEAATIVPTETALSKSILDANSCVRRIFRWLGFHDYGQQRKGPTHKSVKRAYLVYAACYHPTRVSLYRPSSKEGAPRFWVHGLARYAQPGDPLALIPCDDDLYVVNMASVVIVRSVANMLSSLQGDANSTLSNYVTVDGYDEGREAPNSEEDPMKNPFLVRLLDLQQDGEGAISAPGNWIKGEPLLEVRTRLDEVIEDLANTGLQSGEPESPGRWHFFVGSPGNGKSAAVGKLCRLLVSDSYGCSIRDPEGRSLEDLAETDIPYYLDVYEPHNPFPSMRIVQDASVVRDPYGPRVDPAMDLLDTLEDVWRRGMSLIVCTNRGVIEKAHWDYHGDSEVNRKPWFRVLGQVCQGKPPRDDEESFTLEFDAIKAAFPGVQISFDHLDNLSLLVSSDVYDRLIQEATAACHWSVCSECPTNRLCPFRANRDWLADDDGRTNVLRILRRAEVLSGQVIVFREALALLSLLLSGCPADYPDNDPCRWVRTRAETEDVFGLASRRLYMVLFSSHVPFGMDRSEQIREYQTDAIQTIIEKLPDHLPTSLAPLRNVLSGEQPSTDVGVGRLLALDGVLAELDPSGDSLPSDFLESWEADIPNQEGEQARFFSEIEERCLSIWREVESAIEILPSHEASDLYWPMRRWTSSFTLYHGALVQGKSAWSHQLDEFIHLLEVTMLAIWERTSADKRALSELSDKLEMLMRLESEHTEQLAVELSDTVLLTGNWVVQNLDPQMSPSNGSESLTLSIQFGDGKDEESTLAASTFAWLSKSVEAGLDRRCFPPRLLSGIVDARVRSAAKGGYAFSGGDVELVISPAEDQRFRLKRIAGGDVLIEDA